MTERCSKCGELKDCRNSWCLPCRRAYERSDAGVKRAKEWRQRNAEKRREYQARYRAKHPEKIIAHNALNHAIRDGKLIRLPCEIEGCGDLNTHGHHDDYSKPLVVRWFCRKHHKEADLIRLAAEAA